MYCSRAALHLDPSAAFARTASRIRFRRMLRVWRPGSKLYQLDRIEVCVAPQRPIDETLKLSMGLVANEATNWGADL